MDVLAAGLVLGFLLDLVVATSMLWLLLDLLLRLYLGSHWVWVFSLRLVVYLVLLDLLLRLYFGSYQIFCWRYLGVVGLLFGSGAPGYGVGLGNWLKLWLTLYEEQDTPLIMQHFFCLLRLVS